ncbi:hypothetical protein [Methanothermobacter sp.]|uniref:hypothetical protein n=1 Tax=Methanothermobacter sp. TaxID=1884223 RepID=UPI003C73FA86
MANEIKQLVIGISREGEIIVKSNRGRIYPVKVSPDLSFSCEDLFRHAERELYATINTEVQPWECVSIEYVEPE